MNNIVVAITGGVAAYKTPNLIRLLSAQGANVQVVMTEAAKQFIGELTLQAVSGNEVRTALFDSAHEAAMGHIELAKWADTIIVAPASANFMAKYAQGLADDLLSTILLATEAQVYVAPAMNQAMWRHPATQANYEVLQQRGVKFLGPDSGEQACGDNGPGRMLEPEAIITALTTAPTAEFAGKTVLITAGPTREAIDPVRYLSNHSSGKMGYSLAAAFANAGAKVRLVTGPVSLAAPEHCEVYPVQTGLQMYDQVMNLITDSDIYIATAAVADYRAATPASEKLKRTTTQMSIDLVANPDITRTVALEYPQVFSVGFAAETSDLARKARAKFEYKSVDLLVANDVSNTSIGFNADHNEVLVLWSGGELTLPYAKKSAISQQLLQLIKERYHAKHST